MPPGADAGDQHVKRRVAKIVQDFPRGGADMDFDIGGIFKLLRHPCTVGRLDQLDRALNRALHRSEEHTSELQSLMRISYAVFCLKKKKISRNYSIIISAYNTQ